MKKFIISFTIILILFCTGSFWYYSNINVQNQERLRRRLERKNTVINQQQEAPEQEKPFNKKYTLIYEEPSALHIYVPLGLSSLDMKANLEHAAKSSGKDYIFAYRIDDRKHDGGYTAGRYHAGKFDMAEVYTKSKQVYPAASEAVINKNNVNLYSRPDFEPSDVLVKLKKNTQIMIIEHAREFTTTDITDLYKIIVQPEKHIGWVMDSDINNVKYQSPAKLQKELASTQTKKQTKKQPEEKSLISFWSENLIDIKKAVPFWRNELPHKRVATCGMFLFYLWREDKLKIDITGVQDLKNYAEILANRVETFLIYSTNNKEGYIVNYISIGDMLSLVASSLNWITLKNY